MEDSIPQPLVSDGPATNTRSRRRRCNCCCGVHCSLAIHTVNDGGVYTARTLVPCELVVGEAFVTEVSMFREEEEEDEEDAQTSMLFSLNLL